MKRTPIKKIAKAVVKEMKKEVTVEKKEEPHKKPGHDICRECNHSTNHHYGGNRFWCNSQDCRCVEFK